MYVAKFFMGVKFGRIRLNEFGDIEERIYIMYIRLCLYVCVYVCSGTIRDGMEPVWGTLCYVLNSKPFVPCRVHSGKRSKQLWLSGTIFPFRVILFLLPRSGHTVRWCGDNDDVLVLCCRIASPRIVPSPHLYRSNLLVQDRGQKLRATLQRTRGWISRTAALDDDNDDIITVYNIILILYYYIRRNSLHQPPKRTIIMTGTGKSNCYALNEYCYNIMRLMRTRNYIIVIPRNPTRRRRSH